MTQLKELRLSARTYNALTRAGYVTYEQVLEDLKRPDGVESFLRIPNLGIKGLAELFNITLHY